MSKAELERQEREVEEARARVIEDIMRLGAPEHYAEARQQVTSEVLSTKDRLVGKAKDAAWERADGLVDVVKARVAANPGAALAIGAGLAWRLYRHPPIASLLVGAGVMGLLRTDPDHPAAGSEAAARAAHLAARARRNVQDWRDGDTVGRLGELAGEARDTVSAVAQDVRERVEDYAGAASEQIGAWRTEGVASASRALRRAGRRADQWTARAGEAMPERLRQASARDKYLLGAAALALAAAVGVSAQRRQG